MATRRRGRSTGHWPRPGGAGAADGTARAAAQRRRRHPGGLRRVGRRDPPAAARARTPPPMAGCGEEQLETLRAVLDGTGAGAGGDTVRGRPRSAAPRTSAPRMTCESELVEAAGDALAGALATLSAAPPASAGGTDGTDEGAAPGGGRRPATWSSALAEAGPDHARRRRAPRRSRPSPRPPGCATSMVASADSDTVVPPTGSCHSPRHYGSGLRRRPWSWRGGRSRVRPGSCHRRAPRRRPVRPPCPTCWSATCCRLERGRARVAARDRAPGPVARGLRLAGAQTDGIVGHFGLGRGRGHPLSRQRPEE